MLRLRLSPITSLKASSILKLHLLLSFRTRWPNYLWQKLIVGNLVHTKAHPVPKWTERTNEYFYVASETSKEGPELPRKANLFSFWKRNSDTKPSFVATRLAHNRKVAGSYPAYDGWNFFTLILILKREVSHMADLLSLLVWTRWFW